MPVAFGACISFGWLEMLIGASMGDAGIRMNVIFTGDLCG